jgi:hypothetical protein
MPGPELLIIAIATSIPAGLLYLVQAGKRSD